MCTAFVKTHGTLWLGVSVGRLSQNKIWAFLLLGKVLLSTLKRIEVQFTVSARNMKSKNSGVSARRSSSFLLR